jgi:hypothetical protein
MVGEEPETVQAPGEGRGTHCDLCRKDLRGARKYPCQDCSFLICPSCIVNAAILHPGHTVRSATRDDPRPSSTPPHVPENTTHTCRVCQRRIAEVRYECQKCTNATKAVNICGACCDLSLHPGGHQLKAINCALLGPTHTVGGSACDADESGRLGETGEAHDTEVDASELDAWDDVDASDEVVASDEVETRLTRLVPLTRSTRSTVFKTREKAHRRDQRAARRRWCTDGH